MNKWFAALLSALVLLPVVGAVGMAASGSFSDPAPVVEPAAPRYATIGDHIRAELLQLTGSEKEEWIYVTKTGPFAGAPVDAAWAIKQSPSKLRRLGQGEGVFMVRSCALYSTTGSPQYLNAGDRDTAAYCTQRVVTRAEVRQHLREQARTGLEA